MAEEQVKTSNNQVIRNEKGQVISGTPNPNGRPKGVRNFTTKVREALEKIAEGKEYSYEEAFIKAILKKAIIDQDTAIMRLIWNYLDGMPAQDFTSGGEKITIPIYGGLNTIQGHNGNTKDIPIEQKDKGSVGGNSGQQNS